MADKVMMPPLTPKDLYEQDMANDEYLGNKKVYWPTAREEAKHDQQIRMENLRMARGKTNPASDRSKAIMNHDEWFKTPFFREELKNQHIIEQKERKKAAEEKRAARDYFGWYF